MRIPTTGVMILALSGALLAARNATTPATDTAQPGRAIAAGAADAAARLQQSPRHAEWAMIPTAAGSRDSIAAWVVYPEVNRNAPVVVVIHEIFGLSTWVRAVADQLAAEGYIAIAPDLLSMERGGATTDSLAYDQARTLIRNVLGTFGDPKLTWKTVTADSHGLSHAEIDHACRDAVKQAILADRTTVGTTQLRSTLRERQDAHCKRQG